MLHSESRGAEVEKAEDIGGRAEHSPFIQLVMGKYRRFLVQELVEKTCSLGMGLCHRGWDGLERLRWEAGNQFENYNNSPYEKS